MAGIRTARVQDYAKARAAIRRSLENLELVRFVDHQCKGDILTNKQRLVLTTTKLAIRDMLKELEERGDQPAT